MCIRDSGDTVGYTFGILSQDADISADNTSALLEDIKDGLGGKVDTTTYSCLLYTSFRRFNRFTV